MFTENSNATVITLLCDIRAISNRVIRFFLFFWIFGTST